MFDPCECCPEWRCDPMCNYYVPLDDDTEAEEDADGQA